MNADLVLFLIEHDMPLDKAKAVAGSEPASVAELALALIENGVIISMARELAEGAPLQPSAKLKPQNEALPPAVQTALQTGSEPPPIRARYVPVVGPDGLTDKQRDAVGNVGLCPNCQQPRNSHLPGCAVASGEAPRAITKDPLPPVQ